MENKGMPKARKRLVSLNDTAYYHCVSRCVRRAFLCGKDEQTGFDFEHRRQWIADRMIFLSTVFAIDVCAYAVMSNHYHIVLHVDCDRVKQWDERQVAKRWLRLFSGPVWVKSWLKGRSLNAIEREWLALWLKKRRKRLFDLSWFMRCLNEPIARMANAEDHCTGRFWEGRFKSQALLDERAIASCMAYVDLNPIRAKIAKSPVESDFTSLQRRIREPGGDSLMPFASGVARRESSGDASLPFHFRDYLEFVGWAGQTIRMQEKDVVALEIPYLVERLRLNHAALIEYLQTKPGIPLRALGSAGALRSMAASVGLKFLHGVSFSKRLYSESIY